MDPEDQLDSDYNDPSQVMTQDDSGDGSDQSDDLDLSSALSTINGAAQVVQSFQQGAAVLTPVVVSPHAAAATVAAGPTAPGFVARMAAKFKVSTTVVACSIGAVVLIVGYGIYKLFKKGE